MFPPDFLWGAATSAYQVEGGNNSDWTKWHKGDAGRACDHYNRFREDFSIAKSLGHNAHRFSIEWSRIEPEEGKFNESELNHYREVILALKENGLEPFITLWHFTLPVWFAKKGGWLNKDSVRCFERYVAKVVQTYRHLGVKFWITLNEPDDIYAFEAYSRGRFPPQQKSFLKTIRVLKNLIKTHKRAYKIIHQYDPNSQVGFANNVIYFEAYGGKFMNRILKFLANRYWNFWFFRKTMPYHDFIGCNYYYHNRIKFNWLHPTKFFNRNDNCEVSDIGFEIYPEGIYHVLKNLKNYNLPVYILENGIADAKDEKREKFIKDHLYWIYKAIQKGVDVRGYFYWSLLDNFEWDKGFWPRFGLVKVDYKTFKRSVKPSALEYKKIIESNSLSS